MKITYNIPTHPAQYGNEFTSEEIMGVIAGPIGTAVTAALNQDSDVIEKTVLLISGPEDAASVVFDTKNAPADVPKAEIDKMVERENQNLIKCLDAIRRTIRQQRDNQARN